MASITTRQTGTTGVDGVTRKNAPLTNTEIDNNFIGLNDNKLETTWTGSTNIVTLGTVTTGTWNATTIGTNKGGTGLTTFNANGAVYATSSSELTTGTLPTISGGTGLTGFTNGGAVYATSTSALTTGTLPVASGGTGQTSYTNGQLLIGNTTGNTLTKTTLTAGAGITITNGNGSITISAGDLSPDSDIQFDSLGVGTAASGTTGEIRATNQITSYYSDERLKTDIQIIPDALNKVLSLRGVTYKPNNIAESFGFSTEERHAGVIAQDVKRVLPEAVKSAPFDIMIYENNEISRSGENYMTVQYEKLVPLLIESIKELNRQIEILKESK
jgi:hypothetical protein